MDEKKRLMGLIANNAERYGEVRVFFGYDKRNDVYENCLTFNKDMGIKDFFDTLMRLPDKVRSFESYFEVGRVEYVLE